MEEGGSYLVGKSHPSSISQEVKQMSSDDFFPSLNGSSNWILTRDSGGYICATFFLSFSLLKHRRRSDGG